MNHQLLKSTATYAISDGISKGLSFITLPFVSYYLIPSELGIAANFDVLQSILSLLAWMAVVNALPYFYYDRDKKQFAQLVSSLLFLVISTCIIFAGVILACHGIIAQYIHLSLSLQLLTVVNVVTFSTTTLSFVLYRIEEAPKKFMVLQISQTVVNVTLLILFVIVMEWSAVGKILTSVCTFFTFSIVHIVLLYKRGFLTKRISFSAIKELLHFGVPLIPHSLSFWLKGGMDKVLLTTYCGLAVNGLYSMALSFGACYSLFYTAFKGAYVPYLQKRLSNITENNELQEKKAIVKQSYKIIIGFFCLYFVIVGGCWIAIHYLLSDKYQPSFEFIPFIILSSTIYSIYGIVIEFPYTIKKTFGLGIVTFTGSVVQLGLTFILIREFGADGIKASLVMGSLLIAFGVWWYSNKVYPMPWLSFWKRQK